MDSSPLLSMHLARDALVVLAMAVGAVQCFFGSRIFDRILGLHPWVLRVLSAAVLVTFAYLMLRDENVAVAFGIWSLVFAVYFYVDLFFSEARVAFVAIPIFAMGLLFGIALFIEIYVISAGSLSPDTLVSLGLLPFLIGVLSLWRRGSIFILGTAFAGAGLVIGGIEWLASGATDSGAGFASTAQLVGTSVLGLAGVVFQHRVSLNPFFEWARSWRSEGIGKEAEDREAPAGIVSSPRNRRRAQAMTGHRAGVECVLWDPKERWVATQSREGDIVIWAAASGRPLLRRLYGHGVLAVSPDGRWLLAPNFDRVLVWNTADGSLHRELIVRGSGVDDIAVDRHGRWFATTSRTDNGKAVEIWDLASFTLLHRRWGFRSDTNEIVAIPEKGWLAWIHDTGGMFSRISLMEIGGQSIWVRRVRLLALQSITLKSMLNASQDGRWLVYGTWRGFFLWDLARSGGPRPIAEKSDPHLWWQAAFDSAARHLAVKTGGSLHLYDLPSDGSREITGAKTAPDGSWLIAGRRLVDTSAWSQKTLAAQEASAILYSCNICDFSII